MRVKVPPTVESPSPVTRSPRARKRKGNPRTHQPNFDRRGVITLGDDDPHRYEPMRVSGFAPRIRGAKIRNSKRWISGISPPVTALDFPYIDKLGRFTGTTLFKWSCDTKSYVSSLISTILDRLMNRAKYYNDMHVVVRNSDRLVRAACYYAFTKNLYVWNRILYFVKNLTQYGTQIHKLVLRYMLKTDAHKRFVYGHVCNQTQWLLFRAERPRDKSAIMRRALPLLSFERRESALQKIGSIVGDLAKAMSTIMPSLPT